MKNSALQWSLVWQVRCQRQHCKSQPQGFQRHKQSLPIFKEPAQLVGWMSRFLMVWKWCLSKKSYTAVALYYIKLFCILLNEEKTQQPFGIIQVHRWKYLTLTYMLSHTNGVREERGVQTLWILWKYSRFYHKSQIYTYIHFITYINIQGTGSIMLSGLGHYTSMHSLPQKHINIIS